MNRDREIVRRIRAHATIGRGTCSVIDECYSDDELIAEFGTTFAGNPRTVTGAVRAAVSTHNSWEDRAADIRGYGGVDDEIEAAVESAVPAWTCTWLVERFHPEPDFPSDLVGECGAPVTEDDDGFGWRCEAGHSHRSMEARAREGWDYFDDDEIEAARNGAFLPAVDMRDMAGREVF
jgi:hypothetical protein